MKTEKTSDDWILITRGMAMPWHCDHYGHMNVRWYTHFFDDSTLLIWSCIGIDMRTIHESGTHTVIAKSTIEYLHEVKAGDPLRLEGRYVRLGKKSVTVQLRMLDANTDEPRAQQETVIVFFDASSRTSTVIPANCRARLEPLVAIEKSG